MPKSYVSLEQNQCVVCLEPFDTGAILLDKRLRENLEQHTVTGWGMCPVCKDKKDKGFVALIECDPDKSTIPCKTPSDAFRLGTVVHIHQRAWTELFKVPVPDKGVAFCPPEVIEMLRAVVASHASETPEGQAHDIEIPDA